jgi:UrcA family protein
MMKTLLLLAAALGASLAASPASAQAVPAIRVQTVHLADLNLASDAGRARLDQRLRLAVETACGTASDSDLHGRNLVRRCRIETSRLVSRQRDAAIASRRAFGADYAAGR